MTSRNAPTAPKIYPAWCFPNAPTYQKWVKFTAADVGLLHARPGFEGQKILFHLNHPIDWIYLFGTVVAIDHKATQFNTRFCLLEIDDGSGSTIDVKINCKKPDVKHAPGNEQDRSEDIIDDDQVPDPLADETPRYLQTTVHATDVDGLSITTGPAIDHLISLNGVPIVIGTVLKLKGKLARYRSALQLELMRAFISYSLDEEIAHWEDYADFAERVLSKPWILSDEDKRRLMKERRQKERQALKAAERRRKLQARKRVADKEAGEKEARREARREKARQAEAMEMNGNALDRPGWTPYIPPPAPAAPLEKVQAVQVPPTAAVMAAPAKPHNAQQTAADLLRLLPKTDMLSQPPPEILQGHVPDSSTMRGTRPQQPAVPTTNSGRPNVGTTAVPSTSITAIQAAPRFYRPVLDPPLTHDGPWFHELAGQRSAYRQSRGSMASKEAEGKGSDVERWSKDGDRA